MSATFIYYDGDGVTTEFTIPFEYLAKKFVKVSVDGIEQKGGNRNDPEINYYFLDASTVKFLVPPKGGTLVLLKRVTSDTEQIVSFNDGSVLKANDLNIAQVQAYHIAAEARDRAEDNISTDEYLNWDARGRRITGVGDPVADSDAVNYKTFKKESEGAWQARNQAENFAFDARASASTAVSAARASEETLHNINDTAHVVEGLASEVRYDAELTKVYTGDAEQSAFNAQLSEDKALEYANRAGFAIRTYDGEISFDFSAIDVSKIYPAEWLRVGDLVIEQKGGLYRILELTETQAKLSAELGNVKGPKGDTGAKGDRGERGVTGDTGPVGPTGPQGPKGDTGATGPKGDTGAQGERGLQGPKGDRGLTGETGPQGERGLTGEQGPKGETGAGLAILGEYGSIGELQSAHPTGKAGDAYLITGDVWYWAVEQKKWNNAGPLQGPIGPQGIQGKVGPKGDTGPEGPRGLTGGVGPAGPQGIQGIQGLKGDRGETGPQGPIGPKGDAGPKGDTGPEGPKGDIGPQGPAGEPAKNVGVATLKNVGLVKPDGTDITITLDGVISVPELKNKATTTYVNQELAKKATTEFVTDAVKPKADKTYVDEVVKNITGMPIGAIFMAPYTTSWTPTGAVLCDGTEYRAGQFNDLWNNFLITNRVLTCSYSEYQADIAKTGSCAKFAVDTSARTFKVPNISKGTFIESGDGTTYEAGLPNITGEFTEDDASALPKDGSYSSGAFSIRDRGTRGSIVSVVNGYGQGYVSFDASRSSSIYGKSLTVQPKAVSMCFYVQVAIGSVNESMFDWARYMEGLNGKANVDLTNVSSSVLGARVVESWTKDTNWYRVYSDGWIEQGGRISKTGNKKKIITLHKKYTNSDYSISLTKANTNDYGVNGQSWTSITNFSSMTPTNFSYDGNFADTAFWEAKGR